MKTLQKTFYTFIIGMALGIFAFVLLHNPLVLWLHILIAVVVYWLAPEKVTKTWQDFVAELKG